MITRIGAMSQKTRSETVTISRDKHVVLLRTSTESTENIFFLCAAAGESFLPERAVNPRNHAVLSLRGTDNPGVNITPTKSYGTHRVLRQVIAQLQFWIFQEARQGERVVAGFGQRAPRQCRGACRFDLHPACGIGLRVTPTGWYIWAGDYSSERDFFERLHTSHLRQRLPELVRI